MSQEIEENNKQLHAVNELLRDYSKAQAETIKQLKIALIVVSVCFSLIICTMVAGFFWYESQFETVETTTTTLETEGENAIGYENLATSNEVQRGFDNQNSMANQRDILSAVNSGTAQAVAATNQTFHDTLGIIQNRYDELARDISGLAVGQAQTLANQNECCCSTKMLIQETGSGLAAQIAQNKYDAAMNLAQVEARLTAKMDANKIDELQSKVNQLELAQATAGVLRFPNQWSYGAGPFPPIFGGCCGQANI